MDISGIGNSSASAAAQNAQNTAQKVQNDEFERKLKAAMDSKDDQALKKVSQDLESVFVNMMLKEMRSTVTKSDLIESAPGKDIFESMFDEKISEEISKKKGGIGIADMIYKQMSKQIKNQYKVEE